MKPLNQDQAQWVEQTFQSLSPEHRLAQLLIPKIDWDSPLEMLQGIIGEIPFGGLFVWGSTPEEHRRRLSLLQHAIRVPIVVAADLEIGAGYIVWGGTQFPDMLALATADQEEYAYQMGKAAAIQGRNAGIHWTYAPVVDVNKNPDNPIANTRSLGDDPARISRLARAIIRGMQENGLAACAKHFPGDGIDDVDQHAATSVNSLSMADWKKISGKTFADAFAEGVYSVMIGHIALPVWDGEKDYRGAFRPATVSPRITTDLLRQEMKFQGLVVTDDMNMGGVSGYMNRRDRTVHCIKAGCDMLLFPRLPLDYESLLAAMKSGELPAGRIDDACRKVLEFKARLNLHKDVFGRDATADEKQEFESASRSVAEKAIVLVRDFNKLLPLNNLKPGAQVLTVTMADGDHVDVPLIDKELTARGFKVKHLINPSYGVLDPLLKDVEAIFVNMTFRANWAIGSVRSVGPQNRMFMNGFYMEHPNVVFTSFGSPYHLRQFSGFPNLINVHSVCDASQAAAVKAWFGEIPMTGKSPVENLVRNF